MEQERGKDGVVLTAKPARQLAMFLKRARTCAPPLVEGWRVPAAASIQSNSGLPQGPASASTAASAAVT
jgi:hypothetical protein